MSKYVAIESMIESTTGPGIPAVYPPPATAGTWSAGSISVTEVSKLSVDGDKIIKQAKCTFTFTQSAPTPIPPTPYKETLTLSPSSTILKDSGDDLLVVGDKEESIYANKLEVKSGQTKLKTS